MKKLLVTITVTLLFLCCQQAACDSRSIVDKVLDLLKKIHNLDIVDKLTPVEFGKYAGGAQPQVQTTSGLIYGGKNEYANSFFAIPYAVPPINDNRFKPPMKLNTPDVSRNLSTDVANYCAWQGSSNEDCLVLNVHVPTSVDLSSSASTPTNGLPVLLFIHGGAFFLGSGTQIMYDGRYLSHVTSTIVVTVNYRLGPLGFLVFNDGEHAFEGNQGLKDQRLAMQWVNENIQNFGGDKNKVTLFGESAGAQSTMFHLLSKKSEPLYRNAIMESNPAAFAYPNRAQALDITDEFIGKLRCNLLNWIDCCPLWKGDYDCLMEASTKSLMSAMNRMMLADAVKVDILNTVEPFRPYIDGTEYTDQPLTLFKEGKWCNDKPIIIGITKEELVILNNFPPMGKLPYKILNRLMYKGQGNSGNTGSLISEKYIELYGSSISNYNHIFGIQMTDYAFGCPSRALARFAVQTTKSDVYYYVYDHTLDGPGCSLVLGDLCNRAFHASELFFVFRTKGALGVTTDLADKLVSNQFSRYWGYMAWSGNPSEGPDFGLEGVFPDWPKYENVNSEDAWTNLRITNPRPYMEKDYMADVCDFWDTLGLYPAPA